VVELLVEAIARAAPYVINTQTADRPLNIATGCLAQKPSIAGVGQDLQLILLLELVEEIGTVLASAESHKTVLLALFGTSLLFDERLNLLPFLPPQGSPLASDLPLIIFNTAIAEAISIELHAWDDSGHQTSGTSLALATTTSFTILQRQSLSPFDRQPTQREILKPTATATSIR
jgi:hypothetical protein